MTTFQRNLTRGLIVAILIVVPAICFPLTLVGLFRDVPPALLYSKTLWRILYGIMPTEFYLSLPIGVAIAVAWTYDRLVSDHEVDVLYSAGYSSLAVMMPALVVAALATVVGLCLSSMVAPQGVGQLYQLVYEFKHNLHPAVLEPQKFYVFDEGRRTISFDRWTDEDTVANVFLRDLNNQQQETIVTAVSGQFVQMPEQTYLYLVDGTIQTRERGQPKPTILKFEHLLSGTGLRGTESPTRQLNVYELGTVEFLAAFKNLNANTHSAQRWTSEALKRFGAPLMTVVYALIGMGIILRGQGVRRESWWRLEAICAVLVFNHALLMLGADGLTSIDARVGWAVLAVMIAELIVGILLVGGGAFVWSRPPTRASRARAI